MANGSPTSDTKFRAGTHSQWAILGITAGSGGSRLGNVDTGTSRSWSAACFTTRRKQGPSEEIFQVRNQWTLGLCGLAASIACSVTVWGQEDIQQQVANREQAIAQFRTQYPGVDFYESANRITKVYGMPFGGGPSPHDVGEQFRFAHSAMLGVP